MKNTRYILLLSAIAMSACQKPADPVAGPRPALVMTIKDAGAESNMSLAGEVKSRYESPQGFRVAGKIVGRKVEVGALVKKGQVLARLDNADAHLNVASNAADVAAAEAQLALAKSNLDRQRQLIDKKFISAASLDSYEAQYKSAQARVQQTKAQTAFSGNQSQYTVLVADRDGVVTSIHAEPGQVVSAGEVIANIADPNSMEVQVPVPESRMQALTVGGDAKVRLWASRETLYDATIREIAPAADPVTRTFLVKVTVKHPDENMRLGMTAGVRFTKEIATSILVPSPAVMQVKQQATVWVVDAKHHAIPKPVQVASYREDGALISAGLQVGDQVVVAGAQALVADQEVRPVEASVPN